MKHYYIKKIDSDLFLSKEGSFVELDKATWFSAKEYALKKIKLLQLTDIEIIKL